MVTRPRALATGILLVVLVSIYTGTPPQAGPAITSPQQAFGAAIGDDYFLATYRQLESYWTTLDAESDRLSLVNIGRTEEGRTQWMAVISAPENLRRLEHYRQVARRLALAEGLTDTEARALAADGKAVIWIDGGLHAGEVLGAQQLIETTYQLASRDDPETRRILRDVIVLAVHANPDGHALVADWYMRDPNPLERSTAGLPRPYQKYVGHDNNRDFYMATQAETINMSRVLFREWLPQVVYNHHQSAPPGSIMFVPPFGGPSNQVIDPLVLDGIELMGGAMQARLASEGRYGVTTRGGADYSTWWNGGLRTTPYFHNQIGLLTETIGHPTPIDVPRSARDEPWRFRDSIEYSLTANRAVLDAASRHRERLLYDIYRMGRRSIERGRLEAPRGYVLPADQPDFPTATKFVNALIRSGVAVHRARTAFEADGTSYPRGSYVVKTAQAFRPHVLDMFEPQRYPDEVVYPGGPPRAPYDAAGWTLAYQMGVTFDRIAGALDGALERLDDEVAPPAGLVRSPVGASGYLLGARQNDAAVVVNRLLAAGDAVYWLPESTFVQAGPTTLSILQGAAAELGLDVTGVVERPTGAAMRLRQARVGLVDRVGGWSSSGWIRWLLEQYEFPFEVVYPDVLDAGGLASPFDVLILPNEAVARRRSPITLGKTMPALLRFVEGGGTLIAIGDATSVGRQIGLPLTNPLVAPQPDGTTLPLSRDDYYVPGSLLRVAVDTTHPVARGVARDVDVFFDNSPVFRIAPDAPPGVRPVAWFASPAPLRSGWARGQQYLEGAVAAVDAPVGAGRVLLFGPEITFRAQSHGTFKLLFNAIFYAGAEGE